MAESLGRKGDWYIIEDAKKIMKLKFFIFFQHSFCNSVFSNLSE